MAGTTTVTYNGIKIQDCLTRSFRQEPVYAQDGKTFLYNKFTVSVQGWFLTRDAQVVRESKTVNIDFDQQFQPVPGGADRYKTTQVRMSQPAREFKMTFGDNGPDPVVVLEAKPATLAVPGAVVDFSNLDSNVDRNGGPYVRDVSIEEVTGDQTLKVRATYELAIRPSCDFEDNEPRDQVAYGVLSNRWNCVDVVDENRYTTRSYSGEIRLSEPDINPHEFRFLTLPPLEEGMMRREMNFAANSDGLKLRYTIRDEQVTVTPIGMGTPRDDSTYMHVSQREVIGEFSSSVTTHFTITLRGGPEARRDILIQQAQVYADAKLALHTFVMPIDQDEDEKPVIVKSYTMTEEYDTAKTNQVVLSMVIQRYPDKGKDGAVGMLRQVIDNFGNQVSGQDLNDATDDQNLAMFLAQYNQYQSWGNREWAGVLPDEMPEANGTIGLTAALAVHLQDACTTDFSLCSGKRANPFRTEQISNSRRDCTPAHVNFVLRNEIPDLANDLLSASHRQNLYQHNRIESQYDKEEMMFPLPVARPIGEIISLSGEHHPQATTPITDENFHTAHVRIAPPQNIRVIRVESERYGAPPELPIPSTNFKDDSGVAHALIRDKLVVGAPDLTGNGDVRKHSVRAEYVYSMSHSPQAYKPGIPADDGGTRISEFTMSYASIYGGRPLDYESEDPDGATT